MFNRFKLLPESEKVQFGALLFLLVMTVLFFLAGATAYWLGTLVILVGAGYYRRDLLERVFLG